MRSLSGFQLDICMSTAVTAACIAALTGATSKPGAASKRADQRVPMVGPLSARRM
jgi:hypothetical protein